MISLLFLPPVLNDKTRLCESPEEIVVSAGKSYQRCIKQNHASCAGDFHCVAGRLMKNGVAVFEKYFF